METDPKYDAQFEKIREPAIWLRRAAKSASASKLGGLPSLPSASLWPRHGKTGQPLHFLAQIDLASLPKTPLPGARNKHRLPESGILFFFADIEEEMLWGFEGRGTNEDATRVIFAPAAGAPVPAPKGLPEINHMFDSETGYKPSGVRVYPEAPLEAFLIDVYPTGSQPWNEGWNEDDLRTLRAIERATGGVPVFKRRGFIVGTPEEKEEARKQDSKDWDAFRASPVALLGEGDRHDVRIVRHQMLGPPIDVQNTAEEARHRGWVPLFQIDTDRGLHELFMFCDMGMAQFWIKPEDLEARRFDRAWATTEGG